MKLIEIEKQLEEELDWFGLRIADDELEGSLSLAPLR